MDFYHSEIEYYRS